MNSESESSGLISPQKELDPEEGNIYISDTTINWNSGMDKENMDYVRRDSRIEWDPKKTYELILVWKNECPELWNNMHQNFKNKQAREIKLEYLANVFGTTANEIQRKLKHLKSQFCSECATLKRRHGVGTPGSSWQYFEVLKFLQEQTVEQNYAMEGVNLALAEFQAEEETLFGAKAKKAGNNSNAGSSSIKNTRPVQKVSGSSAPPPLPASSNPRTWPEQPLPKVRPSPTVILDDSQIFGDFVASELRCLRVSESRKKLKRIIQKAILQIGEEDDSQMMRE